MVGDAYKLSKRFPKEELFGLTGQLRREVTPTVLNIAEGNGCDSDKEFLKFPSYALRSKHEVTACLDVTLRLGYTDKKAIKQLQPDLEEISSMIIGLDRSLRKRA